MCTIPFQYICMLLKGHLAQHQKRYSKSDLSITSKIKYLSGCLPKPLSFLKVYFCVCEIEHLKGMERGSLQFSKGGVKVTFTMPSKLLTIDSDLS